MAVRAMKPTTWKHAAAQSNLDENREPARAALARLPHPVLTSKSNAVPLGSSNVNAKLQIRCFEGHTQHHRCGHLPDGRFALSSAGFHDASLGGGDRERTAPFRARKLGFTWLSSPDGKQALRLPGYEYIRPGMSHRQEAAALPGTRRLYAYARLFTDGKRILFLRPG